MAKAHDNYLRNLFASEKTKVYIDLYETMCSKFREDQFKIEHTKKGFDITVTTLPPNFSLPSKIRYWDVKLKKGKTA